MSPRRQHPRSAFAAVVALVLLAAACSSRVAPDETTGASGPAVQPSNGPPDEGGSGNGRADSPAEVLRFSAPRLGGGTVEGEDFAGRDVAFWFWAPW